MKEFIQLSGGNGEIINNYSLLPIPNETLIITSDKEGYVSKIKAEEIGKAAMVIGAGRATKDDIIDHAVGIKLNKKVGDFVRKGEVLAKIYYNNE